MPILLYEFHYTCAKLHLLLQRGYSYLLKCMISFWILQIIYYSYFLTLLCPTTKSWKPTPLSRDSIERHIQIIVKVKKFHRSKCVSVAATSKRHHMLTSPCVGESPLSHSLSIFPLALSHLHIHVSLCSGKGHTVDELTAIEVCFGCLSAFLPLRMVRAGQTWVWNSIRLIQSLLYINGIVVFDDVEKLS